MAYSIENNLCRSCINQKYGVKLLPKDCLFNVYPGQCRRCGRMQYIVSGLTWLDQLKIQEKAGAIVS